MGKNTAKLEPSLLYLPWHKGWITTLPKLDIWRSHRLKAPSPLISHLGKFQGRWSLLECGTEPFVQHCFQRAQPAHDNKLHKLCVYLWVWSYRRYMWYSILICSPNLVVLEQEPSRRTEKGLVIHGFILSGPEAAFPDLLEYPIFGNLSS